MERRPPNEYVRRAEFEGYTQRHDADRFAHAELMERTAAGGVQFRKETDSRLSALERWQQRIIGGLLFAAFLTGGGGLAVAVELLRK